MLCFSSRFAVLNKFTIGVNSALIGIGLKSLLSFQSASFFLSGLVPKLTSFDLEFPPMTKQNKIFFTANHRNANFRFFFESVNIVLPTRHPRYSNFTVPRPLGSTACKLNKIRKISSILKLLFSWRLGNVN